MTEVDTATSKPRLSTSRDKVQADYYRFLSTEMQARFESQPAASGRARDLMQRLSPRLKGHQDGSRVVGGDCVSRMCRLTMAHVNHEEGQRFDDDLLNFDDAGAPFWDGPRYHERSPGPNGEVIETIYLFDDPDEYREILEIVQTRLRR